MKIRLDGDEILHIRSEEVEEVTPEIIDFLEEMVQTVEGLDGYGLSAPQVGRSERLIVAKDSEGTFWRFINPEIVWKSAKIEAGIEGCFSIPDTLTIVKRNHRIKIEYLDFEGNVKTLRAKANFARVIQHEIDHLDGFLMTQRGYIYAGPSVETSSKRQN